MQHIDIRNEGNIFLVTPLTGEATEWFSEHVDGTDDCEEDVGPLMWGSAYVIDQHYIEDILEGLEEAGLVYRL